jgi:hypothetical protein
MRRPSIRVLMGSVSPAMAKSRLLAHSNPLISRDIRCGHGQRRPWESVSLGYAPQGDQSAHGVSLDSDSKIRNVIYVADS